MHKKLTPCVGVCSTTTGDNVCRGCFRTNKQVSSWGRYSDNHKKIIIEMINDYVRVCGFESLDAIQKNLSNEKSVKIIEFIERLNDIHS